MKISTKHAGYLENALHVQERKKFIHWGVAKLKEISLETTIDAIVVSGLSGLVLGPILSHLTNIPLLVVRKSKEDCHSSTLCESNFSISEGKQVNLVVLDDLISTGASMQRIHKTLCESFHSYSTYPGIRLTYAFRGILLYADWKSGKGEQFVFKQNPIDNLPDLCDAHTCDVHHYEA